MEKFVWVVCYVDISKIHTLERSLAQRYKIYGDVEAYIPTIQVLQSKAKSKGEYKDVPLLFNYGFFKIPAYFIYNEEFLRNLRTDVDCIYQWLRDPGKETMKKKKKRKIPTIATSTPKEIASLRASCKELSTYSDNDVKKLEVGQVITLKTYPFENMLVKVASINLRGKYIIADILTSMSITPTVRLSFEQIFYTLYNNNSLVTSGRESSLDEMVENGYSLDHMTHGNP